MKLLTIIFLFSSLYAFSQEDDIFSAINDQRARYGLAKLIYEYGEQYTVDDRAREVSTAFQIRDDCMCDYETIACNMSIRSIIKQLTNTRQEYYYFTSEARYIVIGIYKANGLYYCVVHTFKG